MPPRVQQAPAPFPRPRRSNGLQTLLRAPRVQRAPRRVSASQQINESKPEKQPSDPRASLSWKLRWESAMNVSGEACAGSSSGGRGEGGRAGRAGAGVAAFRLKDGAGAQEAWGNAGGRRDARAGGSGVRQEDARGRERARESARERECAREKPLSRNKKRCRRLSREGWTEEIHRESENRWHLNHDGGTSWGGYQGGGPHGEDLRVTGLRGALSR